MSEATICRTCLRLRQGLCDGEKGQTACPWYKRMTNADCIRAMTDEELANWITRHTECEDWQCPVFHSCKEAYALDEYENPLCQDMILNWLKQEVSDNG